jgi:hypothetical protein
MGSQEVAPRDDPCHFPAPRVLENRETAHLLDDHEISGVTQGSSLEHHDRRTRDQAAHEAVRSYRGVLEVTTRNHTQQHSPAVEDGKSLEPARAGEKTSAVLVAQGDGRTQDFAPDDGLAQPLGA